MFRCSYTILTELTSCASLSYELLKWKIQFISMLIW